MLKIDKFKFYIVNAFIIAFVLGFYIVMPAVKTPLAGEYRWVMINTKYVITVHNGTLRPNYYKNKKSCQRYEMLNQV